MSNEKKRRWNPEACSHCGKPAKARVSVTDPDGNVLWLWSACGCQGDAMTVPLAWILAHPEGV